MAITNPNFHDTPAPPRRLSPLAWLRQNLFNTWYNSILTLLSLGFLYWLGSGLLTWIFTQAQWGVISTNLRLFFVGRYPVQLLWRTWATFGLIMSLAGFSWGVREQATHLCQRTRRAILAILAATCAVFAIPVGLASRLCLLGSLALLVVGALVGRQAVRRLPALKTWLALLWLSAFFLLLWLLEGGLFLRPVALDDFSGLMLTILAAAVSIALSFPFGLLLALGRQSRLPVIRWLSVAYIELMRGLPLIGILFMAQVMLPLLLPGGVRLERVIRAIAGLTLFSAAYLAENVRGGLQSVPLGQIEAAKALGLNSPLVLALVVLPQALRAVIPAIVGQFISLFKDTSLLAIVGLVDLMGIAQSILANPKFLGRYAEVYLFVAALYWLCCYAMSLASRQLEKRQV